MDRLDIVLVGFDEKSRAGDDGWLTGIGGGSDPYDFLDERPFFVETVFVCRASGLE